MTMFQSTRVLVAVRERVHVSVVKERMVSVSPGEFLAPNAEMIVGDELRRGVATVVSQHEGVYASEDDDGEGGEEGQILPNLPPTSVTPPLICRSWGAALA